MKFPLHIFLIPSYNDAMKRSRSNQFNATQLQSLDMSAWSALLRGRWQNDDLTVQQITTSKSTSGGTLYTLTLRNHTDPIILLGKWTTATEVRFWQNFSEEAQSITSPCLYTHITKKGGWIVLEELPQDRVPREWTPTEIDAIVRELARFHSQFWNKSGLVANKWLPFYLGISRDGKPLAQPASKSEWRKPNAVSHHALRTVGDLASQWETASNGLRILMELEGWPAVIDEKHLRAAADLFDDPVPILHTLRQLPMTLLHGYPGCLNWRVSVFDSRRLVDWHTTAIGPGICDLITFIETFGLELNGEQTAQLQDDWHVREETMIDTYLLTLTDQLALKGQVADLDTRAIRRAIPAARCLFILLHWFTRFEKWFRELPDDAVTRKDLWELVIHDQLEAGGSSSPITRLRPHLTHTFHRFIRSYYQL